jgi:hypothetical protein
MEKREDTPLHTHFRARRNERRESRPTTVRPFLFSSLPLAQFRSDYAGGAGGVGGMTVITLAAPPGTTEAVLTRLPVLS